VTLNDHQDYFGRKVNVTARVQQFATARAILATRSVVEDPETLILLQKNNSTPVAKPADLAGLSHDMIVYEIQ
jgi:class 3 adenylate cyclase